MMKAFIQVLLLTSLTFLSPFIWSVADDLTNLEQFQRNSSHETLADAIKDQLLLTAQNKMNGKNESQIDGSGTSDLLEGSGEGSGQEESPEGSGEIGAEFSGEEPAVTTTTQL
ncbi:hypothetical protein Ddc_02351 [Ditylenchus destructor]|nr:hypothetical protein Ddc_02351 [Ditylenchus destructor]